MKMANLGAMNILIAPDKFKGSLSAIAVCDAIEAGLMRFDPATEVQKLPLADGGEGTLDVLRSCLDLQTISRTVSDPLFRPVTASYQMGGEIAYIEMAAASGLPLLTAAERDCRYTTTLGTGELIADALHKGAKEIYLFVGGSATNDAGIGMAQALGYRFLDKSDQALQPVGDNLVHIHRILPPEKALPEALRCFVVCDVQNPLYGPDGAAHVYGPQKGASPATVAALDLGLQHVAALFRDQLSRDVAMIPGAGAAGGIAAGAMVFLHARIRPGIQTLMDLVGFDEFAQKADLILTGEGKMDMQTLSGKVIYGVAMAAQQLGKPLGVICGASEVSTADIEKLGIARVLPVMNGTVPLDEAMQDAAKWVSLRAYELMADWLI